MTYLEFHLWFNLPALLLLLFLTRRRISPVHWKWIAVVAAIAFVATSPWDNWAVYKGIWGFDEKRVTFFRAALGGIEWKLPLEEYAFFLIETVLVGLCVVLFLPTPRQTNPHETNP